MFLFLLLISTHGETLKEVVYMENAIPFIIIIIIILFVIIRVCDPDDMTLLPLLGNSYHYITT